jgi:hypothetical protein
MATIYVKYSKDHIWVSSDPDMTDRVFFNYEAKDDNDAVCAVITALDLVEEFLKGQVNFSVDTCTY